MGSEYASVYNSLDNKDNILQLKAVKYFRKKLSVWQGSEYASEVWGVVFMVFSVHFDLNE